ncbi:DUF6773 family protein [Geosporobacter ferrireducens]|nr:DUF6773 family protein [Geosporobacter ferrireducens]MTI58228.1 hypothetical protein [Geosporobacter ferrireducens]
MNKSNLDEMQLQLRNKIGNQSFLMLMYLLLLDVGLYGFGFQWASYPINVVLILSVITGSYVIRLIMNNAYVGTPTSRRHSPAIKTLITLITAVAISVFTITLIRGRGIAVTGATNDGGGSLLFITSVVGLVIAGIVGIIKYRQNKDEEE